MARFVLGLGVATLVAAISASAAIHDSGFGSGGWVRVACCYDSVAGIAVRNDGRILVLTTTGFLKQRLADGRPDPSFQSSHVLDPQALAYCNCPTPYLAVEPDGAALVGMHTTVARFTTSGRRDRTFRPSLGKDTVSGLATLPDGRFVVSTHVSGAGPVYGHLMRFLADGKADLSFGVGGLVALPAGTGSDGVAVQADGTVVVAAGGAGVLRYLADGSTDTTFRPDGIEGAGVSAVAFQPDGKILATGGRTVNGQGPQTEVWRLLPNGTPDQSFGTGGVAIWRGKNWVAAPTQVTALPGDAVGVAGFEAPACSCKGESWLAWRIAPSGNIESLPVPGDWDPDHDCWGGDAGAVAAEPNGNLLIGGDMCDRGGSSAFVGRVTPNLELDAGPPLTATLTHVHMRHGRVTATLALSDAADVTATIRPLHGSAVALLHGSALGDSTRIQRHALHASFANARRVPLVLLFTPRPGASYVVDVSAADDRDRKANVRLVGHTG